MTDTKDFDTEAAHKYFSAHCFNQAWNLIDKADRSAEEDRRMVQLNQASMWHWTQRSDCTPRNLSVGYWQASRIHSLLDQADSARKYAELSLENSQGEAPFYVGYAYEALARAESVAGNEAKAREHLDSARKHAQAVSDSDEKKMLLSDLESIR